ncbi:MAG: uracil-DNA glycosylase [Spirochaetaceae bacterium]|jgi:DNA polymerase|nr:uracil-DNA glycosylase [Spirochaetaceae bacterium]
MTAEQKTNAARFLDTAGAVLKTGYLEDHQPYDFKDDSAESGQAARDFSNDAPCPQAREFANAYSNKSSNESPGVSETEGTPAPAFPAGAGMGTAAVKRAEVEAGAPVEAETRAETSEAAADAPAGYSGGLSLDAIADSIRKCTACDLHLTRIKTVPGEGVEHPLVLVVGEGPGADEDASGRPFVGAAGKLLDKMLLSIGLDRKKNCFIANVIKCRPPKNRDPYPDETAACFHFFEQQLELLRPLLILTVGKVPVKTLLGIDEGITRLRGVWKTYRGIPLLPSFHPSYLLRDESQKQFAWEDLKTLCRRLAEIDPNYAAETAELRKARNI